MGLSDLEIATLVQRYVRERDRFEKMAATVTRLLSARLREAAIAHIPTFRSKDPESFRAKLVRDRNEHSIASFEREFAPTILDLAGSRVLLYRPGDIETVCKVISEVFTIPEGDRFRRDHTAQNGYCAHHRVVSLREDYLGTDPSLANLRGVLCEVQVVTIGNHVWNELEHDIIYKTPAGRPSPGQTILLQQLRAQLQLIGTTVAQLTEEIDRQRAANLTVIETPEQLQQALRARCGRTLTGDLARTLVLLEALLREVTPASLDKMPLDEPDLEEASARILAMDGASIADDDVRLVIAALWPRYRRDLLEASKGWTGRRGPLSRLLQQLDKTQPQGTL